MPIMQVYKCPVCGAMTEPGGVQPFDWINVNAAGGGEVFDKWECVEQYATGKMAEAAAAE
jgi:hypothetical protein